MPRRCRRKASLIELTKHSRVDGFGMVKPFHLLMDGSESFALIVPRHRHSRRTNSSRYACHRRSADAPARWQPLDNFAQSDLTKPRWRKAQEGKRRNDRLTV